MPELQSYQQRGVGLNEVGHSTGSAVWRGTWLRHTSLSYGDWDKASSLVHCSLRCTHCS